MRRKKFFEKLIQPKIKIIRSSKSFCLRYEIKEFYLRWFKVERPRDNSW
jgi:hypothetical protein